jgi:hypothetical protein
MNPAIAHFHRAGDDRFLPTDHPEVRSRWADDHVVGAAVAGLAALVLENAYGLPDFTPARLTVDLFKSPRRIPTTTSVEPLFSDERTRRSQCTLEQDGTTIARAVLVQYRRGAEPEGQAWRPRCEPIRPPSLSGLVPRNGSVRQLHSDGVGWTPDIGDHQNIGRKCVVTRSVDVVAGEPKSAFVRAVAAAEATSLVTNLGTAGVGYINGDLTVALSREPRGEWVCVRAESHWAADGIAVGTSTLLDEFGVIGTGMVTALGNGHAQIDFTR